MLTRSDTIEMTLESAKQKLEKAGVIPFNSTPRDIVNLINANVMRLSSYNKGLALSAAGQLWNMERKLKRDVTWDDLLTSKLQRTLETLVVALADTA